MPPAARTLFLLVLMALASVALGRTRVPPCAGGRFLVDGEPLLSDPDPALVLDGQRLSIGAACPSAPAKVTANRRGTKLRAKWPTCTGLRGKVLLKAKFDLACGRLTGTLKAKRFQRRFTAARSRCGDGVVDTAAGEACEPPGTAECDATCRPLAPTTTLPVVTTTLPGATTTTLPGAPGIAITSPSNLAVLDHTPIAVAGTVAGASSVACNGVAAALGPGTFAATVPLHEGNRTVTCVADDGTGQVATASINVTVDTTGPRLGIQCPKDGATVTTSPVAVAGMVNDIVVGTVSDEQARVTCNGITAAVSNRTFLVPAVPLTIGPNMIACTATDRAGNPAMAHVAVNLSSSPGARIALVSGNNQRGPIRTALAAPLVVRVLDDAGAPVVGQNVVFRVTQEDGTLAGAPGTGRALVVPTDGSGQAAAQLTLGRRAGAGNNQVRAMAVGFAGEVVFTHSADSGPPAGIVVDVGFMQAGAVGQPLPRPFVAVVVDTGDNRLPAVPVTFNVVGGGGTIGGLPSAVVPSDGDGRAAAVLTLGPAVGYDVHRVEATFAGNAGSPAVFTASARVPGDPAATRLSGIVLDNSERPIPGVTLRIDGTAIAVPTNDQGQFVIQPAPVGHVHLHVDASTATRPGPWPNLAYELVTVAGQDNGVGMPIHLPRENVPEGLAVSATQGGTLTLAAVPGFALTVAPGSATFPGGSKSGLVTVTTVYADKVPMVPNLGAEPRFVVSIQPAGTLFEPPASIAVPNTTGLPPGRKTDLYSFDHDLGQFVGIGTGTVSDDGSVVRSDAGVGILKGGWHYSGAPAPAGGAGDGCIAPAGQTIGDASVSALSVTCKICRDLVNPCRSAVVGRGGCRFVDKPDGARCEKDNRRSCSGVDVFASNTCSKTCKAGTCSFSPFGLDSTLTAACMAIGTAAGTCLPEDLRSKILMNLRSTGPHGGYLVSCTGDAVCSGGSSCACSAPDSNVTYLNSGSGTCSGITPEIFHELLHSAGGERGNATHDSETNFDPIGDRVYGCQKKCTGTGRGLASECK
jgi:hypothetical protein